LLRRTVFRVFHLHLITVTNFDPIYITTQSGVAVGLGSRYLPILQVFFKERGHIIVLSLKLRNIAAYAFFEVEFGAERHRSFGESSVRAQLEDITRARLHAKWPPRRIHAQGKKYTPCIPNCALGWPSA
jgi:hypothetical protein